MVAETGGTRRAVQVVAERAGVDLDRMRVRRFPEIHPLSRLRPPRSGEDPAADRGPLSALAVSLRVPPAGSLVQPYTLRLR